MAVISVKSPYKKTKKVKCEFCDKSKQDRHGEMIPTKCEGKRICRTCWNKRGIKADGGCSYGTSVGSRSATKKGSK